MFFGLWVGSGIFWVLGLNYAMWDEIRQGDEVRFGLLGTKLVIFWMKKQILALFSLTC